jgi:hypothetical protein
MPLDMALGFGAALMMTAAVFVASRPAIPQKPQSPFREVVMDFDACYYCLHAVPPEAKRARPYDLPRSFYQPPQSIYAAPPGFDATGLAQPRAKL